MYGIDAQVPGILMASVASSPVKGGRVDKVDDSKAKAVRGVTQIVVSFVPLPVFEQIYYVQTVGASGAIFGVIPSSV